MAAAGAARLLGRARRLLLGCGWLRRRGALHVPMLLAGAVVIHIQNGVQAALQLLCKGNIPLSLNDVKFTALPADRFSPFCMYQPHPDK